MINAKNTAIFIGILALLVLAYYFGSHTRKSAEIITPSIQSAVADQSRVSDVSSNQNQISGGTYDYTEAENHIGENATIHGTVVDVYTSKSNTTFFDFCKSYKTCPFSAVIFSSKSADFPNVKSYTGKTISVSGMITSYQGKAEIVIDSPNQIGK